MTTTRLAAAFAVALACCLPFGRPGATAAAQRESEAPADTKALDGTYFGLRRVHTAGGGPVMRVVKSYITFFPDGTVLWRLPGEGRDNFDAAASRKAFPDRWGTYKLVGDEVHLDGVERKTTIKAKREGDKIRMTDPRVTYTLVPHCTGIKLDGMYRRHAGEPGIRFGRDGKFDDGGVLAVLGEIQRNDGTTLRDDGVPGNGTYAVRSNTLYLNYDDGRTKKVAFYAMPAEKPGALPTHLHLVQDMFSRQE